MFFQMAKKEYTKSKKKTVCYFFLSMLFNRFNVYIITPHVTSTEWLNSIDEVVLK